MDTAGYYLYLLFVISWFIHLGERIPFLGMIRFDLLLLLCLAIMAIISHKKEGSERESFRTDNILNILVVFTVLSLPFTEWPGSVIRSGIPNFLKAVAFYYFTITYITSEKKLKIFISVFVLCQVFRVMEPLYLHITQGYWGDRAYYAGGYEYISRLSGSPMDIINPNGLAFVINTAIPFLYLFALYSKTWLFMFIASFPL